MIDVFLKGNCVARWYMIILRCGAQGSPRKQREFRISATARDLAHSLAQGLLGFGLP